MKLNIDDQQKALLYKKTLAGEFPDEMGNLVHTVADTFQNTGACLF